MSTSKDWIYSRPYGFQKVQRTRSIGFPELKHLTGSKSGSKPEDYNMAKLLKHKDGDPLDLPDYVGPIEVEYLTGRGRGVIAVQNIAPGQLILVSKALAIVYAESNAEASSKLLKDVKKLGALREAVADLLKTNSPASKLVYQLFAGPELGVLGPAECNSSTLIIDMGRIERICSLNGFESQSSSYGLWFLPSFLNHDCLGSNAHWTVVQDYMFLRATKEIQAGTEVLISYVDPNQPFSVRRKFYLKHEFHCSCALCQLERREGQALRRRRDVVLEDFLDESPADPGTIQEYIDDLEALRPNDLALNIFTLNPLVQLGLCQYERKNYTEAAQAFQRACTLSKLSAQFAQVHVSCALTLATCCSRLGRKTEAEDWVKEAKHSVFVQYGTLSAIDIIRPSFAHEMRLEGFDVICV